MVITPTEHLPFKCTSRLRSLGRRRRWSGSRFIMFSFSFVVWLEEVDFDERKRRKGPSFAKERKASIVDWVVVVVVVSLAFFKRVKRGVDKADPSSSSFKSSSGLLN